MHQNTGEKVILLTEINNITILTADAIESTIFSLEFPLLIFFTHAEMTAIKIIKRAISEGIPLVEQV